MSLSLQTGLSDSQGREIIVKDNVRVYTDPQCDTHGAFVDYIVTLRGLTPMLSYATSELGQVLPAGGSAAPLHYFYDYKDFCVGTSPLNELVPHQKLEVLI